MLFQPVTRYADVTLFVSMQDRISDYEWSDGTKFDYKATISEQSDSSTPGQHTHCVSVTSAGDWVRTNCNATLYGALCYKTNITTTSQSKTAMTYGLYVEPHCSSSV